MDSRKTVCVIGWKKKIQYGFKKDLRRPNMDSWKFSQYFYTNRKDQYEYLKQK